MTTRKLKKIAKPIKAPMPLQYRKDSVNSPRRWRIFKYNGFPLDGLSCKSNTGIRSARSGVRKENYEYVDLTRSSYLSMLLVLIDCYIKEVEIYLSPSWVKKLINGNRILRIRKWWYPKSPDPPNRYGICIHKLYYLRALHTMKLSQNWRTEADNFTEFPKVTPVVVETNTIFCCHIYRLRSSDIYSPLDKTNPPSRNMTRRLNEPRVFAMTIDRPTDPIKRNSPRAIWCIMKSRKK